ncbi:MAG: hypothetical protein BRD48_00700, partial [Bacteroidetes bacterium QS_9_68_14]
EKARASLTETLQPTGKGSGPMSRSERWNGRARQRLARFGPGAEGSLEAEGFPEAGRLPPVDREAVHP